MRCGRIPGIQQLGLQQLARDQKQPPLLALQRLDIICAIPRASLRSVLLRCAASALRMC
jgi:hypothetical protein